MGGSLNGLLKGIRFASHTIYKNYQNSHKYNLMFSVIVIIVVVDVW